MKTNHFYIPVFLTLDGKIYVDYSYKNSDDKVILKRVPANRYYRKISEEKLDFDIKLGVRKVVLYLERHGLEIEDKPIKMIDTEMDVSKNLKLLEIYYFATVSRTALNITSDNMILITTEDFLKDKDILKIDKEVVKRYLNGEGYEP